VLAFTVIHASLTIKEEQDILGLLLLLPLLLPSTINTKRQQQQQQLQTPLPAAHTSAKDTAIEPTKPRDVNIGASTTTKKI
jgi:hypothetical protein